MNTIPLTFEQHIPAYTIVGGEKTETKSSEKFFSVFILGRPDSIISDSTFENILSFNFKSVLAIFQNTKNIEGLVEKFPNIKFIKTLEPVTTGEMINICASECESEFFIVLWSDTIISSQGFINSMLKNILSEKNICTVPSLITDRNETLPNQMVPILQSHLFSVQKMPCFKDNTLTIYPFDFIGIYNRKNFIEIAGFDYTIKNAYWQVLDFFLRAFLFGFNTTIATSFKVKYSTEIPIEDLTTDASYRIFFLKNLSLDIKEVNGKKEAYIPLKMFFRYFKSSTEGLLTAHKKFQLAKAWVSANRNRFQKTALQLVESWEPSV